MTCRHDAKASSKEFEQFWMYRSGFEYDGENLMAMPSFFGDHCFTPGMTYEDSGFVVVKVATVIESEMNANARAHLDAGNEVAVYLLTPARIVAVYRSDDFQQRFQT